VTALYEITLKGSGAELVGDLRYQAAPAARSDPSGEYGFLKIRYKLPDSDTSKLIETPVSAANDVGPADGGTAAREARFSAAVAAFGQLLRGGRYTGDFDYDDVIALAQANKGEDEFGYRGELVNLVRLAKSAASMPRQQ
jgi:Ca-activated chloride channel family protein